MAKPKKKILKELEIDAISAVDRPAQEPALATIMKARGKKQEHEDHDEDEMLEALSEEEKSSGKKGDRKKMSDQKKTADEKAVAKQVEDLQKKLDRAESINSLGGEARKFFDGLSGKAQDEFLAKSETEQNAAIAAAKEADPVVYKRDDGTELRKSAGEQVIAMAKQLDEQSREIAKAKAIAKRNELEKRAESELPNLSGDVVAKADLLGAIDTLPEESRGAVLEMVKSHDAGLGKAFERQGTSAGTNDSGSPQSKIDDLAKRHANENNVSLAKAYSAVLSTPEGRELYTESLKR